MKKRLLVIAILLLLNCDSVSAKNLITEYYVVKDGDSLTSIAQQFITADRYLPEFEEGIFEINYETMNGIKAVHAGQILKINLWR